MFTIDKDKVKDILISELEYKEHEADVYLRDFPELNDHLQNALTLWLEDRTITDEVFFTLTIGELMKIRRSNFLTAVAALNRLFDSGVSEQQRQQMIEDLKQPIKLA